MMARDVFTFLWLLKYIPTSKYRLRIFVCFSVRSKKISPSENIIAASNNRVNRPHNHYGN